jgi:hypothetical protein
MEQANGPYLKKNEFFLFEVNKFSFTQGKRNSYANKIFFALQDRIKIYEIFGRLKLSMFFHVAKMSIVCHPRYLLPK